MEAMKEETFLTTRQAAERLQVNFRTIQNWVEKGILRAWKTAGGHRRIACSSVDEILRRRRNALKGITEAQQTTLKVLIVEDEEALRGVYGVYFESWDMPVELSMAVNGIEGLMMIAKHEPHVVITDLLMPDMDGFAMLRILLADAMYRHIRFIVVTSLSAAEVAEQGGLPDSIMLLKKPMAFEQLEPLIRAIIREMCPS